MAPDNRDYMLRVRMTPAERWMLDQLAAARGITASDVVRSAIRRDYMAEASPTHSGILRLGDTVMVRGKPCGVTALGEDAITLHPSGTTKRIRIARSRIAPGPGGNWIAV